jgi:putative hydrolase of the HAD superfamily
MYKYADLDSFRIEFGLNEKNDQQEILLIDADDTLWENMFWFDRAMRLYAKLLFEKGLSNQESMSYLYQLERRNTKTCGYGSRRFEASLLQAIGEQLPETACDVLEQIKAQCRQSCQEIREHPIELLPGVRAGLNYLKKHFCLWLVSKGENTEQLDKLKRSGLEKYFSRCEICFEKDTEFYKNLKKEVLISTAKTSKTQIWMIGNSPRSDIEAAHLGGLNTIWIPHHSTWQLEEEISFEKVPCDLQLDNFAQLIDVFS